MAQTAKVNVPVMEYGKKYACKSNDGESFGCAIYCEVPQCVVYKFWGKTLQDGVNMNSGVVPKVVMLWIGRPDYLVQKYTILGDWTEEHQREFDAVSPGQLPERAILPYKKIEVKLQNQTVVESFKRPGRPPELGQLKLFGTDWSF